MSNSNFIEGPFGNGITPTKYGDFQICVFYNGNEQAIVLHKGDPHDNQGILCRIQSECIEHFFLCTHCDCQDEMDISLSMISVSSDSVSPEILISSPLDWENWNRLAGFFFF